MQASAYNKQVFRTEAERALEFQDIQFRVTASSYEQAARDTVAAECAHNYSTLHAQLQDSYTAHNAHTTRLVTESELEADHFKRQANTTVAEANQALNNIFFA
jgi:uncharacterized glyoxalase superfamily protein PhnB